MKHCQVRARPDPERAPAFFRLLADSPHATQARLVDWNLGPESAATLLYAVEGDPEAFHASATDTPGVDTVDVEPAGDRFYMFVGARPSAVPLLRRVITAMTRAGMVVLTPVVYRDGTVEADIVGDPEALQAAFDAAPDAVDVTVETVGPFRGPPTRPATRLSDRQRETLEAAQRLGYYETPREATHEDVASELGCAPQTAGDHLRKAEAKLAGAALDAFGPDV